jgi:hypothetical protein
MAVAMSSNHRFLANASKAKLTLQAGSSLFAPLHRSAAVDCRGPLANRGKMVDGSPRYAIAVVRYCLLTPIRGFVYLT